MELDMTARPEGALPDTATQPLPEIEERSTAPGGMARFARVTLEDVDFRRASFNHFASDGCLFVNCDFREMRLDRKFQPLFSGKRQSIFRECHFDGADLRKMDPGQARFERCTFDNAVIDGWSTQCAEFVECHFAGPIVRTKFFGRPWGPGAQRLDPPRGLNEFTGNDFASADLRETAFVMGIDIAAQQWPTGPEYIRLDRIHQRITKAHAEIIRWNELDARKDALAMLQAASVLYAQQKDIFLRRDDLRASSSWDVEAKVWAVLERVIA
jgi:uncharacterized protein YjbI with pentapeptide repeats